MTIDNEDSIFQCLTDEKLGLLPTILDFGKSSEIFISLICTLYSNTNVYQISDGIGIFVKWPVSTHIKGNG